ncbi:MAG: hypothetical protein QW100_02400 [Thermoplasmatales archaeon]
MIKNERQDAEGHNLLEAYVNLATYGIRLTTALRVLNTLRKDHRFFYSRPNKRVEGIPEEQEVPEGM